MTAPAALDRLDDGIGTLSDRVIADLFDQHSSDYWHRLDRKADGTPADWCACERGPKEPGFPECNDCFLDFDDAMRRADDQ